MSSFQISGQTQTGIAPENIADNKTLSGFSGTQVNKMFESSCFAFEIITGGTYEFFADDSDPFSYPTCLAGFQRL